MQFLSTHQRYQLDALISEIYFWNKILHVRKENQQDESNSNLHSDHTLNVAPQYRNLPHPALPANTLHMQ